MLVVRRGKRPGKSASAMLASLLLTLCPCTTAANLSTGPVTRTLLMVDDHDLLYRAGLKRELQPLTRPRPGVPVIAPTEPWESLLGYVSVQQVDDKLMMWYQSYAAKTPAHAAVGINGTDCFVAVAYSADHGETWTKPLLDVYTTAAGAKTNVVFAPSPAFYFGSVLYEPDAPAQTQFKMVYWDVQTGPGPDPSNPPTRVPGLYTAVSADGLHWVPQQQWGVPKIVGGYGEPGPIPFQDANPQRRPNAKGQWDTELSESDAMNIIWDPKQKEYKVYHKTWIDGVDGTMFWKRAVMVHSSPDFKRWEANPGKLCVYPDELDGDNAYLPAHDRTGVELHAGPALYHSTADVYLMLIQHLDWTSKPNPGNLNVELAVSRGDGTEWTRPFRSHLGYPKFLDVNPTPGQFDSGTMWTNPQFVDGPHDTKRLFYGAYQQWSADTNPKDGNNTGIGMVEMTTDRFAYFTNLNSAYPGQVTTKPISINGTCSITINVDTTHSSDGLLLETSCLHALPRCNTSGGWSPASCKGDADCTHMNGNPITCGGVVPSCIAGTCFSHNYKADVCVRNVSAGPGTVKIELLSSAGYRLRGYDAASAVAISGVSGVAVPVKWAADHSEKSSNMRTLPEADEVMFRAHLTAGAKLYAINLVGCDAENR